MSLTGDILRSYRSPGAVARERLAGPVREDRALAVLMGACLLAFVAQWPVHARAAHLAPDVPLDARLAGALFGSLFLWPIVAYAVAGISHMVARLLGGRGSFYGARVALFWAMLAVTPLMLLNGLVRGMIGTGPDDLEQAHGPLGPPGGGEDDPQEAGQVQGPGAGEGGQDPAGA